MRTKIVGVLAVTLLFLISMWVSLPGISHSQTWYPANQATIAWDAVTTLENGSPLPAGSTIQYKVYSKTPTVSTPVELATLTVTTAIVTFTVEGKYFMGVKSQRMVDNQSVGESAISWSDVISVCKDGATFGIVYYVPPAGPKGLRKQ